MLSHLPEKEFITKIVGFFPGNKFLINEMKESFDVIICYSVLHYIFKETSIFKFLDEALTLLAPMGQLLIGDIPNISKRKRFFSSNQGVEFHYKFMNTDSPPEVVFNNVEYEKIDDAVVMALLARARLQGFDAYLLPQNSALPMANRREDIVIYRP